MKSEEPRIDDFLLTEHDKAGKSLPIYFRIPPFLAGELDELVHSGKLPFQSKEEASRWALVRGIRFLQEMTHIDYASPLLHLPLILYRRWPALDAGNFFSEIGTVIRHLSALGYRTAALQKFVEAVDQLIRCLPSVYGRGEFLKELRIFKQGNQDLVKSSERAGTRQRMKGHHGN